MRNLPKYSAVLLAVAIVAAVIKHYAAIPPGVAPEIRSVFEARQDEADDHAESPSVRAPRGLPILVSDHEPIITRVEPLGAPPGLESTGILGGGVAEAEAETAPAPRPDLEIRRMPYADEPYISTSSIPSSR